MRFGFWDVFWILGSVLDSGKCFGFWEVFWILGSVFEFWEVFWHSGKCFGFWEVFWILGSVLDSGKCFVPMGHRRKRTAQKLPRKVIQRCSTAEYQHATKDANFSAQESLDERRRYVLSPHCLFREETFHASNKHDSWNIRNKVRTIVLLSRVSRYCARALKDVCKFPCVCFTLEVI